MVNSGHEELKARALTEEHARDSFENLLFSICRFFELTGHFPHNITVRRSIDPSMSSVFFILWIA
jgi:hypothetical protein